MKLYYAFDLLYVATLCFAKLSVLVLFYYVVVQQAQQQWAQRQLVLGFAIFISLWTVTSLLAVGFQCKLPKPWEIFTLNCFNRVSRFLSWSRTDANVRRASSGLFTV
jgi:hypothetical protein